MSSRFLAVTALTLAIPVLTATLTMGQAPKTPWGDPDLQGIWHSSGATPMERPDEFQGRETLTAEEVSEIRATTEARNEELLLADAQRP